MVGHRSWSSIKAELHGVHDRKTRIRHFTGEEPLSLAELLGQITEVLGGEDGVARHGDSLRFSRGYHFYWESPETDDEMEERIRAEEHHAERLARWERETHARLQEKFGPLKDE